MLATAFNLEYPDFEKFDETAAFIKEYLPRYNEQKQAQSPKMHNLDARRAASALADGRIRDLYRLFAMRKGGDCCREYALFLCRVWMLADGCTMQEICLELGISERTYARDKAAIAASETVNDNAAAIQDEPAVLAVPDNQTAPTKAEQRNGLKLPRRAALPKIQSIYYKKSLISALSAAQFLAWWAVLFGAV